jgi:hypothetical protein
VEALPLRAVNDSSGSTDATMRVYTVRRAGLRAVKRES